MCGEGVGLGFLELPPVAARSGCLDVFLLFTKYAEAPDPLLSVADLVVVRTLNLQSPWQQELNRTVQTSKTGHRIARPSFPSPEPTLLEHSFSLIGQQESM